MLTKATIEKFVEATEGVNSYDRGIFQYNIVGQLTLISGESTFKKTFKNRIDTFNNLQKSEVALIITPMIKCKGLLSTVIKDRLFVDSVMVIGTSTKSMIIKFSNTLAAKSFCKLVNEFNKH